MTPEVRGLLFSIAAGVCTTLGGACVFFVKDFRRLPLACCMATAAGVMVYVSFVDVLPESFASIERGLTARWKDHHNLKAWSYCFGTICFFGGWALATFFDFMIDWFIAKLDLTSTAEIIRAQSGAVTAVKDRDLSSPSGLGGLAGNVRRRQPPQEVLEDVQMAAIAERTAHMERPAGAPDVDMEMQTEGKLNGSLASTEKSRAASATDGAMDGRWFPKLFGERTALRAPSESRTWEIAHADECFARDSRKFLKTGVFTALALTVHNLPEGFATFSASLTSFEMGAAVAVAIGVHNIPEGFAVSVPLYFGTGKKWQSFLYSVVTGFAEPIGALLAWGIFGSQHDGLGIGLAFGVIGGIMSNIAIKELLPSAYKYDPCNQATTTSFVGGMLIMALSLVLFEFEG